MEYTNKLASVTERDIDLLILEELNVSKEFASWFYSTLTGTSDSPSIIGAWHSINESDLGESDIIAIYENKMAILIENKIDAVAQPAQGDRYRSRGLKGIESKKWNKFITCMIAPESYLEKEADSKVYNVVVSYESISKWFLMKGEKDLRSSYKSYVIREAIEKNRRGYTPTSNLKVTEFWEEYWKISIRKYPDLEMKKPSDKPVNSNFIGFSPETLGKRFVIYHKLHLGYVDLQINGVVGQRQAIAEYYVDSEVTVESTGKSTSLRLIVAPLDLFLPFESQKYSAIEGLNAARKLLVLAKDIPAEILKVV